jgi:DNA-binding transcriptional LysR family regulator
VILAAIAGLTIALLGKSAIPPPPASSTKAQPAPDAQPPSEQPYYVLVWIESTPPGARIVRVSDGFGLGWTPEIVEFLQSKNPVPVRLELEGFVPETREVPAVTDGQLAVELKAIPKKHAPATKRSKGSRRNSD